MAGFASDPLFHKITPLWYGWDTKTGVNQRLFTLFGNS